MAISVVILIITNTFFIGCQKIINLNLVDATPQLVIEGLITDSIGPFRVKLSKSDNYYNQSVLPLVSDAVVVITDNEGTTDTLKETKPGIYLTSKILGIPGRTYNLEVLSENTRYTASSTMSSPVAIDSLRLRKSYPPGFGISSDGQRELRVEIHCFFRDPPEKNYYRTFVYINKRPIGDFKVYDDQYANGRETELQVKRAFVKDTIRVDLMSLDKSTFEYYRTIRSLLHSDPVFGSTPSNPNTNLSNGALGYFGTCAVSSETIIITDSLYNSAK